MSQFVLDLLMAAYVANLDADDYDPERSVELLTLIREVSPEAFEKIKTDIGYRGLVGGNL